MVDKKGTRGGYTRGVQWNLNREDLTTIRVPKYLKDRAQRLILELHQAVQESKPSCSAIEEE